MVMPVDPSSFPKYEISNKPRTVQTDKAAEPTSVLGKSKLKTEELTAWVSMQGGGNYMSVRFGNVLESRGCLVPTMRHFISTRAPVPLTTPEAIRFSIITVEACQLVLQAAHEKDPGHTYIIHMRVPIRIVEIARRVLEIAGVETEIVFTGLRPGGETE